jgi:hypothetical protein
MGEDAAMAFDPRTPGLRASDADREATVERLRVAAVEGRLDADELEERLTAAYASRYCSELERLTQDVTPAPVRVAPTRPVFAPAPARHVNPLAIASVLLGVFWAWFVGSLAAVVLGHVALRQIGRSGGRQSGRALAVAGLLLGYGQILLAAFLLLEHSGL